MFYASRRTTYACLSRSFAARQKRRRLIEKYDWTDNSVMSGNFMRNRGHVCITRLNGGDESPIAFDPARSIESSYAGANRPCAILLSLIIRAANHNASSRWSASNAGDARRLARGWPGMPLCMLTPRDFVLSSSCIVMSA